MLKKLSILLVLMAAFLTVPSFAQTICAFPSPGGQSRGNVAVCSLPPVQANQCVEYHFLWTYSSGTATISVTLNSSLAFPVTVTIPQTGNPDVFELKGKFCAVTQHQEFVLNSPLVENTGLVTAPQSGSMTEDLSVGSTLTFVSFGQRGFGDITFLGGTVAVQ